VDTSGAGDAFTGALAVALAAGLDVPAAAAQGCLAGAHAVTRAGAQLTAPLDLRLDLGDRPRPT
jgi:ribokinase